jgi:hypothetical protein
MYINQKYDERKNEHAQDRAGIEPRDSWAKSLYKDISGLERMFI